jgi:hypothetical protein
VNWREDRISTREFIQATKCAQLSQREPHWRRISSRGEFRQPFPFDPSRSELVSAIWTVLVVFGAVFLSALLLIAAAFFSPVVFTIDSVRGQARLRWLALLEYHRPLPWAAGESGLSIAGKPVKIARKGLRPKRRRKVAIGQRVRMARFLRRCLATPAVRNVMANRLKKLGKGILRSATLTRRQITISLPDPAWNGMLAGWMAGWGYWGSAIRVDFSGQSGCFFEVRLYPYRVAKALLLFTVGLPYRALWREWRGASAMVSG